MELCINALLEWVNSDLVRKTERVLWISADMSRAVLIEIFDESMPHEVPFADLSDALQNGECRLLAIDPYVTAQDATFSEKHRDRRDRAWAVIEPIVTMPNGGAFDEAERYAGIVRVCETHSVPPLSVYRYLKRYWKRGQTKNALVPDYKNSGAPGKERTPGEVKRGRPAKLSLIDGQERGINIGPEERRRIELGMRKFYENEKAANPPSMKQAYRSMISEFFHSGFNLVNGVPVPVIASAHEVPTWDQAYYWYNKTKNPTAAIIAREGQRRFNLKARAIGGDAAGAAFGPGSVYQIDSTPADVHLVSSFDRNRRIGRPVLYFIVDVFSRLITGVAVTLEEESYIAAMLALENALTDKVAYCEQFGITIKPEDWPSHHIPEALVADRGELLSKNMDCFANTLGIRVVNTPAYRPDLKPFIERSFLSVNAVIHQLPGAINQRHERGDKDERMDAVLTINEFRKIVLLVVVAHNRQRIERFRFQEFMISENVDPRPAALWEWGTKNRAPYLRTVPADALRLNLLPRGEARVTDRGIRFQKAHYTCATAQNEQWQVRARTHRSWKIEVAYHPHHTDILYLVKDGQFEPCTLMPANQQLAGRSWCEVDALGVIHAMNKDASVTNDLQVHVERDAQVAEIVSAAVKEKVQLEVPPSKAAALAGIHDSRTEERDLERLKTATAHAALATPPTNVIPIPATTSPEPANDGYVARPSNFAALRAQRAKHHGNSK